MGSRSSVANLLRRPLASLIVAAACLAPAAGVAAGQDAPFRLFLNDGGSVAIYGEYARVGDRVVFTVPLGDAGAATPPLQLVSLAATEVDWTRTEEYLDGVRAARYVATRGEADYADLSTRVASALQDAAATPNAGRRLEIVEQVRREVAEWPAQHHAYRARDVAQISALLDEAVGELRAEAGTGQFDLNLVAAVEPPPRIVLPPPTPAEAIEQVLGLARRVDVPAERLALLNAARSYAETATGLGSERKRLRRVTRAALEAETAVERRYRELSRRALGRASARAAAADVRGVEDVLADVVREDERLGRKRRDEVAALVATIEERLDAARRLRLARDQWVVHSRACGAYRDEVGNVLGDLGRSRQGLDDIKRLAGPGARTLASLERRLARNALDLGSTVAPEHLRQVQALLASSVELARQAVSIRQQAVRAGDVAGAWNASSAAAGSMMLFERATQELDACFRPPVLP